MMLNLLEAQELAGPETLISVNFQPSGSDGSLRLPGRQMGSPFDAPRGYGWNTTLSMWSRERGRNVPQVLDTHRLQLGCPDMGDGAGRRLLRGTGSRSGDAAFALGPHRVSVEGVAVITDEPNAAGQFLERHGQRSRCGDGLLTVEIGGGGGYTAHEPARRGHGRSADLDSDGFPNESDNCPLHSQSRPGRHADSDGLGDACDADVDGDGADDGSDNCPGLYNPDQADIDSDGAGDACDNCPFFPNVDQTNTDADLLGDICDPCPGDYYNDADWDGVCGDSDNCPFVPNPGQGDADSDTIGDDCDIDDDDSDGVSNISDCDPFASGLYAAPGEIGLTLRLDKRGGGTLSWSRAFQGHTSNIYRGQVPAQQPFVNNATCFYAEHTDLDFTDGATLSTGELFYYLVTARNDCGDSSAGPGRSLSPCGVINDDSDGDGTPDLEDNCAGVHNPSLSDMDKDFVGDACDNCVAIYNPSQSDSDSNGIGDACEGMDTDSDGFPDFLDNCPLAPNPGQSDADGDSDGDACDSCTDTDFDGLGNPGFPAGICPPDNCPRIANPVQADFDSDTLGDLCDACGADANNDVDDDTICADADNCPNDANTGQEDADSDGTRRYLRHLHQRPAG